MTTVDVDRELKAKHRALWASGDYPAVAAELIAELGPRTGARKRRAGGDRVLDVAAGSGNAAIPAAEAGAIVTASDLTPELFDAGRRIAAERGVELEWVEADAEALPFADNSFDVVMSCVGAMFAPHHQATADELVRVVRPGGTIGMINWTPEGFIGNLFATMKPYAPPPPPGASPAPLWGDEDHVRELFGERVTGLSVRRQTVVMDHSADPIEFREYWKRNYGPTIAVYRFNEAHRAAGRPRQGFPELPDRVESGDGTRQDRLPRRIPARHREKARAVGSHSEACVCRTRAAGYWNAVVRGGGVPVARRCRGALDGQRLDIGHSRQRCVLVALLVDVNRPVPADQLIDRVWADDLRIVPGNALAGYLSRLRQLLPVTAMSRSPASRAAMC